MTPHTTNTFCGWTIEDDVLKRKFDASYSILYSQELASLKIIPDHEQFLFGKITSQGNEFIYEKGLIPLIQYIETLKQKRELNPAIVFDVFSKAIDLLKVLHKKGIYHGSLSPYSILIDSKNKIYFTQWAFARKIEQTTAIDTQWFLPLISNYIAPEQSGKTKNQPALNSDIYALGATMYKLATGQKAVKGQDITQTIYQHLTLQPTDPLQLNPRLTKSLAQIILKCLAKNQKNRYSTVLELEEDLMLAQSYFIADDYTSLLPEQNVHYSTEFNTDFLRKNFHATELTRVKNIVENSIENEALGVVFLYGLEGNGKDNFIENLRHSLYGNESLFLTVRLENDITNPLQSIRLVLDGLTEYLLFQPEDQLQIFSNNLIRKLGLALPALHAFYPRISDLIPQIDALENANPSEAANLNNQLSFAFAAFLDSFFQLDKHLIICFQNLDKANTNTLQFIQALYKEFDFNKLFTLFTVNGKQNQTFGQVEALRNLAEHKYSSIELNELSKNEIKALLLASNFSEDNSALASALLLNKSGGQYYFIVQLIERLSELKGISYNRTSATFELNLKFLTELDFNFKNAKNYFEAIVEAATANERQFLMYAAAFGDSFLPADLEKLLPKETVADILDQLIAKHLIQLYNAENQEFRFSNAAIREVLLSKITTEDRANIVELFYKNGGETLTENDYLRLSPILLQLDKSVTKRFSNLLDSAAKVAASFSNFETNYQLLKALVATVTPVDWANNNEKCIDLYCRYINAIALYSQDEAIAPLFDLVKQQTTSKLDELRVYQTYGEALLARQNFTEFVTIMTKFLATKGISISTNPGLGRIIFMMIRSQIKMKGKQFADFDSMPLVQDAEAKYILKINLTLIGAAYVTNPKMVPELVFQQLVLTYKYGLSNQISTALSSYAFLTSNFTQNHAEALHVQDISNKLNEKYGSSSSKLTSEFLYACFIANWQIDLENNREQIHRLFHKSRQLGEVNIAFYNLTFYIVNSFYCEVNFSKIESDIDLYLSVAKNQKQANTVLTLEYTLFYIQAMLHGSHSVEDCTKYFDTQFNHFRANNDITNGTFLVLLHNIYSSITGDKHRLEDKRAFIAEASKTLGNGFYGLLFQYLLLSYLDTENQYNTSSQSKSIGKAKSSYKRATELHKENNETRNELVLGLHYIIENKPENATLHFIKSHEFAVSQKHYFTAFLAAKKLYKFYRHNGIEGEANKYLQLCIEHLTANGATASAEAFKIQHAAQKIAGASVSTLQSQTNQIDLLSFIKASNSISGEIKLDQMLKNLIDVLIENAGAKHAGFIINRKNGLYEFASKFESESISTEPQLCTAERYPMSMLRYCYRSAKIVLEDNAIESDLFGGDPYIMLNKIKSILCLPIIKNQSISGVIYLENNLLEGAFTQERIQTLELLASQVAVSLENAMLYNEMEQKVIERTQELNNEKEIVEAKNKEITDSIIYAKRIQAAILPSEKTITELLPNSFVFYRPKDIVAGDFYWLEKKDDLLVIAAADCTGHGVPGAMVSVICNNGLNRSVREYGLTMPGEILNKTRQIVIQEFSKSDDEVNDGMDIALISLQQKEESTRVYFAGANNPLWIIRKDKNEIEEIKPNKQPIGRYAAQFSFETHAVSLQPGDMIYLFTDGFKDQFGGPAKKKFKSSRLKELFLNICNMPLTTQFEVVQTTFDNWKGNLDQIDDVCVMGIRV